MPQEPTTISPGRGREYEFRQMATAVETDFRRDNLAQKFAEGELNDKQYLNELQTMVKEYGAGSDVETEMQSAIVGQKQKMAEKAYQEYADDESQKIQKMISEVELDWADVQRQYSEGEMSEAEFNERWKKYESFMAGLPEMEIQEYKYKEWAPGKGKGERPKTDRFKSVNSLFEQYLGRPTEEGSEYVSGKYEYAPKPWIESTLKLSPEYREKTKAFHSYGRTRNLQQEQSKLPEIIKGLGRMPKPEEINAIVYGGYPAEEVKEGNFKKNITFYD